MQTSSKTTYILPFAIFALMVVFLGIGLTLNLRTLPSALIDKPAPQLELPTLYGSNTFKLHDMKGRTWMLNVWASWCAECKVEHPLLNQLAQQTNIPIIGLNHKDETVDAKKWLEERGNPYQFIAVDSDGDTAIDWGTYGVPETFIIDEKGIVRFKKVGALTVDVIQNDILPLFDNTKNK